MSTDRVLPPEGLKAAIACLDLSLESELALFRRAQSQAREALLALPLPETEPESWVAEPSSSLEPEDLAEVAPAGDLLQPSPPADEPQPITSGLVSLSAVDEELETLPEPYTAELTAEPEAFEQFLDPSIEDYLESSEALLKHLDEPVKEEAPAIVPAPSSPQKSWVTASGILLIGLGMVILAGIITVLATRLLMPKKINPNPTPIPQSSAPLQPNSSPGDQPLSGATQSKLGQGGASEPTVEATPIVVPSPSPIAANYIVLMDYRGLDSLEAARAVVPDAFIAEIDGKQHIQMGYLETVQQAQQVVQDLKQRGFSAKIQGLN